jgi:predicted PurR-regulated permease PerM
MHPAVLGATMELRHGLPGLRGTRVSSDSDAVVLHTPINPRSLALTSIAIVTGTAGLWFAQAILIPIMLAVFISYALVIRAVISGIVTVATAVTFWALAGGACAAGFLQFGTLTMALVAAGSAVLIASLEGFLITPWLIGRAGSMNAAAVFIGLSFLGWVWGIWGLLLAVPIMMAVKAVCDHVEDLKPIGEMLAD